MKLEQGFNKYFRAQVKRVLTQLDRDPDSPTYGCFDRNYWHYKTRDFPSSILQQAAFVLEHLRKHPNKLLTEATALEWTVAAINALSRQAEPKGGVAEYYPFEDSYPASAFALYCTTKILMDWQSTELDFAQRLHWSGIQKLANRLSRRMELQAANQYAAGVAALAMASLVPQLQIDRNLVEDHADRLFELQHAEGWFQEYGGPDFGYLSVTIDALIDYHDAMQDERALTAIDRAVEFYANMIGCDGELPWTLNARNTDYVVPYGLVRTAKRSSLAAWVVQQVFGHLGDTSHSIWATDDRYHLHYIYSSITRSLPYLCEVTDSKPPNRLSEAWYPGCGYLVKEYTDPAATVYVGGYKGGVVRVHRDDGNAGTYDNGWRLRRSHSLWTTNWWQRELDVEIQADSMSIKGRLVQYKPLIPSPIKHFLLRVLAKLLGRKLTSTLKRLMIFRRSKSNCPEFLRIIRFSKQDRSLCIKDQFSMANEGELVRSPRQNLRHVASADSFSIEENLGLEEFLSSRNAGNAPELFRRVDI